MRCIYPYAANESTHNNEARTNAILFIQTTPLLTTLKLYTLENDVRSIEKSGNAFLSSNFLVKSSKQEKNPGNEVIFARPADRICQIF